MQGKLNWMAEVIKLFLFFRLFSFSVNMGCILASVNFGCFFTEQVSHFHCNAMRKAIKVHTNLHTNSENVLIHEDKSS